MVKCVQVGIFECSQAGLIGLHWRFFWWSKFEPSNWIGSARTAFPLFFGGSDFGTTAGVLVRFWGLVEFLLGVATFFARLVGFCFPNEISSG